MEQISLNGIWKLWGQPQEDTGDPIVLKGTVPGCVQLDLSEAGYLPRDLYIGENILQAEKHETWQWWYERKFNAPDNRENIFLVFEGVDCIAHYYLNGIKIGDSENMFISHEFDVGKHLKAGENTLTVHIESPVLASHKLNYSLNSFTAWNDGQGQAHTGIRKAAHSYGWDIMPRAVTSGIWRDVRLEMRDPISFSQMYFCATATQCEFLYELSCPYSDLGDIEIELEGSCKDSTFHIRQKAVKFKSGYIPVPISKPYLWWPYGYGDPNIYEATVRIYSHGKPVHETATHFGIRNVELQRSESTDGQNGYFQFLINNTEILCKGSNWVPLDAFHCRDAQRYDKALSLVKDIGCNILRCWGGNVYEDHAFFDFCDRNGIMVWQDFSMACAIYPQDARFITLLRNEAESVVRKLRQHPSIILWAGDNEVDIMSMGFGINPSGNRLTREILPQVIHENDKYRPYLPSSPYISAHVYQSRSSAGCPEAHLWDPRDYYKSHFYKENQAHFVSETGYHGCPSLESIKRFITSEKIWPYRDNTQWILHSSNQRGNDSRVILMEKQVRQLFSEVPENPEDYILASQISQAEAKSFSLNASAQTAPTKPALFGGIYWTAGLSFLML